MKTYKVTSYYECDDCDSVTLEYLVKAGSEESAFLRAMAKHRRTFLGGDVYQMLKESKAHARHFRQFFWKNHSGVNCSIKFNRAEEIHGSP